MSYDTMRPKTRSILTVSHVAVFWYFGKHILVQFMVIWYILWQFGHSVRMDFLVFLMGFFHNPTNIRENCVVQHLEMLYDKSRIDPICENCVIWHILSDCVYRA
jgi:hypothetical protein